MDYAVRNIFDGPKIPDLVDQRTGKRYSLSSPVEIGRAEECKIAVPDLKKYSDIKPRHAILRLHSEVTTGKWRIILARHKDGGPIYYNNSEKGWRPVKEKRAAWLTRDTDVQVGGLKPEPDAKETGYRLKVEF